VSTAANPIQTLQQRFLSGSTPIPNWFFDEILNQEEITDSVKKTFLFLFRKTVGWNAYVEEQSLTDIMQGANLGGRNTAIHAIQILCGCWGLWKKTRGQKGESSSTFEIAGVSNVDDFRYRISLTDYIYDTTCPTLNDLRDLPPTEELYESVGLIMRRKSNNLGGEIDAFVQQQRSIGQQKRAEQADKKRRKREERT
jgi:hypothetical protein